ncbi:MAG TPA: hypothetical protein VN812_13760 [Candidatus Acidoferrales bacterium]|nr:hypothetical protein [Candidatus Acidoferrales bacterium]
MRSLRPPAWISGACFALSALSFVAGWILLALAAPDIETFFYQPRVLAVTHTFTLGWISLTMIGVLYQFVPALTKQPILWPRGAALQVAMFALGASGMVSHFWIGHLSGMVRSAGLVIVSVLLLAVQLIPSLLRAPRFDATVIGLLAALVYFVATAILGMLYAIDKVQPFLGGRVLSNIAGHADLGLLGWITLTICAVSYRMVAAFVLPEVLLPDAARRQVIALILLVPALLLALLLRSRVAGWIAIFVAAVMGWYAAIVWQLLRTRRMPLDWSVAHVVAALVNLGAAIVCGLALMFFVDSDSTLGNCVVVAFGVFALVGWISNYIIGMATRMAPGLFGKGGQPLLGSAARGIVFVLLNGGILAVVAAAVAGRATAVRGAAMLPLSAGLLFGGALLRRLTASAPTSACRPTV